MEQIVKDITGLVGGTPLLEAARFGQARGLSARLLCKLEYLNPVSYTHLDVYKRQPQGWCAPPPR